MIDAAAQIDLWQEQNTRLCRRFHIYLSHYACKATSAADPTRCFGCGGLDNQPAQRGFQGVVEFPTDLQPIVHDAFKPHSVVDEDELNELLAELFPAPMDEREDASCASGRLPVAGRKARRKLRIYAGRCRRCGGFMSGDSEKYDPEVCRCLNCGWRVSPQYDWNRGHQSPQR